MRGGYSGVCVLALLMSIEAGILVYGQQEASLSLKVSDQGTNEPLPGVNVRILDAQQRVIDCGPTDGKGIFKSPSEPCGLRSISERLRVGQQITIEYQLFGYVRDPERLHMLIDARERTVDGWLIKRDSSETYLRNVVLMINQLAREASSADAKRGIHESAWERVAQLPPSSQQFVASRIPERRYLLSVPTFRAALESAGRGSEKSESAKGELTSVDAAAWTMTLASGQTFLFNDQTKVSGAQGGVAGLASMSGREVTIDYETKGADRIATAITVAGGRK
jgi:hypothetical protein